MPSTVIAHISYNVLTATLCITYVSGNVYEYKKVEAEVVQKMKAARSKGTFLNKHIKNKYAYEKVK